MEKRVQLYVDKEHVKKTFISIEDYLFDFFSIYLGYAPNSPAAKVGVKEWLQNEIFRDYDKHRKEYQKYLKKRMIFEITDKKITESYWDYIAK